MDSHIKTAPNKGPAASAMHPSSCRCPAASAMHPASFCCGVGSCHDPNCNAKPELFENYSAVGYGLAITLCLSITLHAQHGLPLMRAPCILLAPCT